MRCASCLVYERGVDESPFPAGQSTPGRLSRLDAA
jgi:hypothetical protein